MRRPDEKAEKAWLIGIILDRIKPIPEKAPDEVKDAIDAERQILVLRTGWSRMSVAELRAILGE